MVEILRKIDENEFPFDWIDWDSLRRSKSNRVEIYLLDEERDYDAGLTELFTMLFGQMKNDIRIFYNCWGDFANKDEEYYKYYPDQIQRLEIEYSETLRDADIAENYNGSCECLDWKKFLAIELEYVLNYRAMYGHYFYSVDHQFFFYFHHSGSIGLYYKENNTQMREILRKAGAKYRLEY